MKKHSPSGFETTWNLGNCTGHGFFEGGHHALRNRNIAKLQLVGVVALKCPAHEAAIRVRAVAAKRRAVCKAVT